MEPDESNSKRKQPEPAPSSGWLHPVDGGEWRGSKKAKSVSGSRSPSPSGTSTPTEVDTNEPARSSRSSRSLAKLLPRSRERKRANATKPSPQTSPAVPQDPAHFTTPIQNPASAARSGLEEAFRKLRVVTDTVCPPLCSVIDDLTTCLHVFEAAANNRQEYNDLTDELKSLVEQLIRHLHAAPSEDITDSISIISEAIRKEIESIGIRQSRGGIRRRLDASGDDEDLRRRYRRIKQLFQQILGEASMSTWNITSEHFMNTQLEGLQPAKLARFDSSLSNEINRRTCTENTRTKILQASLTWSEDPNGAKIYWMNGMAGTGKTTIATTLSATLEARKQLAASFFCTRTSPECREAKRIVPTIAYQFSRRSTPFRSVLCKALKEDPDISTGSISTQFELLIRRPLMKVQDKLPDNLVVVVDALDECSDPHIVEMFLGLLFRSIADLPIKFYVTSRPEPAIRNKMMSESEHARSILYLHEIEKSLVQADIELYLTEELQFMTPAEFDIKKLAEHADNLFIYAATAMRYIHPTGKTVDSQARLSTILAVNPESKKKLSGLDALYSAILVAAINDQELEPEERESIRLVLWTAICACEPILVGTLSVLCGLDNQISTTNALQPLRSVLHVSEYNEVVTTLHASFPDYMLTQERSGVFFCDKDAHNQFLAQRCFEIMEAQLRFNIGSIKSSFIPDSEIPGLEEQTAANISQELLYACRFWADHSSQTNGVGILVHLTHVFLSKQLLFWMEVLNLKQCMAAGTISITKLNKWLLRNDSDAYPNLLELGSSASRFIISYISSPTSAYTPHIYLSLLPLLSSSNPLRSCHLPRFKGLVGVSGTVIDSLEGSTLSGWRSDIEPKCAAFSPSSDLIVLGSGTGEITVQNAYNGRYLVQPYKAHQAYVQCLDISSNGMCIVSGSDDGILYVWSVQDGTLISGPFKGHTDQVTSAKFSPSGAHVVSGSSDCIVGVWNSSDATVPMRSFIGHTDQVTSVDVSPDGTRIVSGSSEHIIRVWDLSSGATVIIIQGPESLIGFETLVRFTPDSTYIISASSDSNLYIWNASNGSSCSPPLQGHSEPIISAAISPEGDCIAAGSLDGTVRVWNKHTGKLIAGPFQVDIHPIMFVGFSDDGMHIICASIDKTVQVRKIHGRAEQAKNPSQELTRKTIYPHFMVSPNLAQVVEALESRVVIWDLQNTTVVTSIPIKSNYKKIMFLQLSLNSTYIFTMHDSGEFCTWKTDTAELMDGPHFYPTGDLQSATCSIDGTRILTCSKGKTELWDTQSHQNIDYYEPHRMSGYISIPDHLCIAPPISRFSQGGKRFLTGARNEFLGFYVWDANDGSYLAGPLEADLFEISPDGTTVFYRANTDPTGSEQVEYRLMNVDSGKTTCISFIGLDTGRWTVRFSHDSLYIALTSILQKTIIWDIRDQTFITIQLELSLHDSVQALTYTPNAWCQVYHTFQWGAREENFQVKWFRVSQPFSVTMDPDGWLRDSEFQPLLWVPQEIRKKFPRDSEIHIKNGESLRVDYSDMLVGDEWSKCYIGD
ncbi:vegetative incompatibility protein HET-E-1 [Rhizoctonia solani AG-3 Rhs1AP]|uniref:Vegetative incompatibility protein HET-E-1 n=1 Tax=Rhizoctonia solani AG-3 Rhs1AP TaxID=1086054 RepID=X8J9Z3_9AGAM|nr:vegetative incompatibility protein HET-E-1 [Rhizoctonia solani AG-3 Rhs1AP]